MEKWEGSLRRGRREKIVKDGENCCKENDKREEREWVRRNNEVGQVEGGREESSLEAPIDRVQLDWLHRPRLLSDLLCPPITPLSSPSPLPLSCSEGPKW